MVVKRTRILGAVILVFIFYIAFSRSNSSLFPGLSSQENTFDATPISLSNPNEELTKPGTPPPQLLKDAHELESADDFFSHFKAVTQLPGITLEEAKLTCTWTDRDQVNFQYGDDQGNWVKTEREEGELKMRREEWQYFVNEDMIPWTAVQSRFSGRGIVVAAGNEKSLKRLKVLLKALSKLGTKLPVEVHHWNDELGDSEKFDLSTLWSNIHFNDLSADSNLVKTSHGGFINYQLKTAAVLNSRFAEILLLDSDNIPMMDPEVLFQSDTYQEYGTLFWPDIARTRPQNPAWPISNTRCRMDEYEQESGQLMVDKRRYFYHLQLAAWLNNEHSSYYNEFLLGDKDMFRFSWHMLKTQYGSPKKWITSVGTEHDGFYCGHSFAQHHPNGSIAFLHGGLLKTMDVEVLRWNREKKGGVFRKYKRSKYDERHDMVEKVRIIWDGGSYMPEDAKPEHVAHCTNMEDVEAKDLDELLPGAEKFFNDIGGYWRLDEPVR